MIEVPLAYKFVAIAVMLMEINYCAERIQLPVKLPITLPDIRRMLVGSPVMKFTGRIDTDEYAFSFGLSGQLRYITRLQKGTQYSEGLQPPQGKDRLEHLRELSRRSVTISLDEAYALATNWLSSLEVDVGRLQTDHPVVKEQLVAKGDLKLPIYSFKWGKPGEKPYPRISVTIAGDTKTLLELRQEDLSYSKRPADLLRDSASLQAIPDAEFKKYTAEQRRSLLIKHSAVSYPDSTIKANGGK